MTNLLCHFFCWCQNYWMSAPCILVFFVFCIIFRWQREIIRFFVRQIEYWLMLSPCFYSVDKCLLFILRNMVVISRTYETIYSWCMLGRIVVRYPAIRLKIVPFEQLDSCYLGTIHLHSFTPRPQTHTDANSFDAWILHTSIQHLCIFENEKCLAVWKPAIKYT